MHSPSLNNAQSWLIENYVCMLIKKVIDTSNTQHLSSGWQADICMYVCTVEPQSYGLFSQPKQ